MADVAGTGTAGANQNGPVAAPAYSPGEVVSVGTPLANNAPAPKVNTDLQTMFVQRAFDTAVKAPLRDRLIWDQFATVRPTSQTHNGAPVRMFFGEDIPEAGSEIPLLENLDVDSVSFSARAIDLEPKEPLYHYHLGKLLTEGRDELIKTGSFTRPKLDDAMLAAFAKAAELAPDNFAYAYRHAEAYYDLETPRWDEAFALWGRLDARVETPLEHQTLRLHQANILLKQGKAAEARVLLGTVTELALAKQKQTLLDSLAKAEAK